MEPVRMEKRTSCLMVECPGLPIYHGPGGNQGAGNPSGVPLVPKSRREKDSKGQAKTLSQSWPETCLPPWLHHALAPRTSHFSVISLAHLSDVPESEQAVPWLKQTCWRSKQGWPRGQGSPGHRSPARSVGSGKSAYSSEHEP